MRSFIGILVVIFSIHANANNCDISGEYRCVGGRTGTVSGKGSTIEEAKIKARDQARDICRGRVDFVRFIESTATC